MMVPITKRIAGLDLGQSRDYSCLVVLDFVVYGPSSMKVGWEYCPPPSPSATPSIPSSPVYSCRFLRRWPLQTSYVRIAEDLVTLWRKPELSGSTLAVDKTGVGAPIAEFLLERMSKENILGGMISISITGGSGIGVNDGGGLNVGKRVLVSTLQLLLQTKRLKISRKLPDSKVLCSELQNFRIRVTNSGQEQYESWGGGIHDDTVVSIMLAGFAAEKKLYWEPSGNLSRRLVS